MYSNYRGPVDRNRGRIYKACPVKTGLCTTEPVGTPHDKQTVWASQVTKGTSSPFQWSNVTKVNERNHW